MTIRERMLAAYRGEAQDRPALGIYIRYLPRGEVDRAVRDMGMGLIDYVPLTTQIGPPWHMLPGFLSEIDGASLTVKHYWKDGLMREVRTYDTPVGSVYADIGQSAGAGSEHIASYYLKSPEDYRTMRWIVEHARLSSNTKLYQTAVERMGEDGVVMGRMDRTPYQKLLLELAGGEQFLMDLYDDPEPVEELMEALGRRYREQVDRAVESPAEILWIPDNVTVDMTPPSACQKYLLPHYQYCVKCAHQAGKRVALHYDGRIRPLIPFLKTVGADILESVSAPSIGGDMAYRECLTALLEMSILPNFPSNLCDAPDEAIEACVRDYLLAAAGRPFMLQISEDLAEGTWRRVIPLVTRTFFS